MRQDNGTSWLFVTCFLCILVCSVQSLGVSVDELGNGERTDMIFNLSTAGVSSSNHTNSATAPAIPRPTTYRRTVVCVTKEPGMLQAWFSREGKDPRSYYDCHDFPSDTKPFTSCKEHAESSYIGIKASIQCDKCNVCNMCDLRKKPCNGSVYSELDQAQLEREERESRANVEQAYRRWLRDDMGVNLEGDPLPSPGIKEAGEY